MSKDVETENNKPHADQFATIIFYNAKTRLTGNKKTHQLQLATIDHSNFSITPDNHSFYFFSFV